MKVQYFLLGLVAALTLGAVGAAGSVPLGSHSTVARGTEASPSPSASPSATPSSSPTPTEEPSNEPSPSPEPSSSPSAHPCNHGFYVSQAAHGKHGGAYTSSVAQSQLGKDGDCSQPLPSPGPSSGHTTRDQQQASGSPDSGENESH